MFSNDFGDFSTQEHPRAPRGTQQAPGERICRQVQCFRRARGARNVVEALELPNPLEERTRTFG